MSTFAKLACTCLAVVAGFALAQTTTPGDAVSEARKMTRPDAKSLTSETNAKKTVPRYGEDTSAISAHHGGGYGDTVTPGVGRVAGCASASDVECQAVNMVRDGKATRPTFTISETDPLITNANNTRTNATAILGPNPGGMTAPTSSCTTTDTTTPATFFDQTCDISYPSSARVCDVVRDVLVDRDANYRCDTIGSQINTLVCDRIRSVTVTLRGTTCPGNTWVYPFPVAANAFVSGGRNVHFELGYYCEIDRADGRLRVSVGAGVDGAVNDAVFTTEVDIATPLPPPGQLITTLSVDRGYQVHIYYVTTGNEMTADRWTATFYYTTTPPAFVPNASCSLGGYPGSEVALFNAITSLYDLPGDPSTCYRADGMGSTDFQIPATGNYVLAGSTYPATVSGYSVTSEPHGIAALNIERPRNLYDVSDGWINNCAALEARR